MRKYPKIICMTAMLAAMLALNGCGKKEQDKKVQVSVEEYQPVTYNTELVVRGNIEPALELKLKANDYEKKIYYPALNEMEVQSVNVSVGDIVSKGTVMVEFKSGELGDQIEQYRTRVAEDELLLDHYNRLSKIDTATDYSDSIQNIKDDMEIAQLYMNELEARIESYNIVAEGNGVVSVVSEILDYGIVDAQDGIITVKYGTGEFSTTTSDDYDFKLGDVFPATFGMASLDMELIDIQESGTDADGNTIRSLTFQAIDDDGSASSYDTLYMNIEKTALRDVIYVPKDAVMEIDERFYVYVMDDRNMRHGIEVTVGDTADGFTVIKNGLSEGDKVVID
ncbi:MAG: efflux RND transporter periplasmic adaptor subunit [Clostridium sp.]|nr:efflux RND transporter periplasmic adaptor subunit [Clostridium sp.]MCM1398514.1 efflux RND transporter periplasmic adaptor subunit [Clostridium sp.]MCM1460236.1 efflux RND transporter periplasmic adaptor subunit [Bacteroides sp.]